MPVYKSNKPTKDGRCWYFSSSYKSLDGYKKYKSKLFATKKEASNEEAKWMLSHKENDAKDMSFSELISAYLTNKEVTVKPTSFRVEKINCDLVNGYLGKIRVKRLTKQQYLQFKDELAKKDCTISYKNKMLKQVRSLMIWCKKEYGFNNEIPLETPYFPETEIKKKMDFYTYDEFKRFISVAEEPYKAFFTLLFFCGLRFGEADALQEDDINFTDHTISITKTAATKIKTEDGYLIQTPKTKSSVRTIPMPPQVENELRWVIEHRNTNNDCRPSKWLFMFAETSIQKVNEKYAKLSGTKKIRIHDFRHSCASLLINNGANITLVSQYLGHSDIELTLNTYSHFYKNKMDELVETIAKLK